MGKIIPLVIITILAYSDLSQASTGTLTFKGELAVNTCDVIVDDQAADATVVLPAVSVNQLTTAGQTAGDTVFVIGLRNCGGPLPFAYPTAAAFFEMGPSVDSVTGRLINISGSASNVSLQLRDRYSNALAVIQAGNQNQSGNIHHSMNNPSQGSLNLPYIVRYYAESQVTPGTVVSNVIYSIQYR